MNILIVGINPADHNKITKNSAIYRLHEWMNRLGINHWSFFNVIPTVGLYKANMVDYELIEKCTNGYEKIVALGGFVSNALKKANIDHFEMPHPSSLNRKLNDKEYETRMLILCKEYIDQ